MFILSKLAFALMAPGNVLSAAALLALVLWGWGHGLWRCFGRRLVAGLTVSLIGLAILPIGDWLARPLEQRFPTLSLPAHVDGIIALGGAIDPTMSRLRRVTAINGAAERLTIFATLVRQFPSARAIYTGGSGSVLSPDDREAPEARRLLAALGVPVERILFEPDSRNTVENASYSRALAKPQASEIWLLITSAWHMPRAVGVFRQVGWEVVPVPVDYRTVPNVPWLHFDLAGNLGLLTLAVKEWVGLIAYRLLDRTNALFPASATSAGTTAARDASAGDLLETVLPTKLIARC